MASPTKPARPAGKRPRKTGRPADRPTGDYGEAFPNSTKVYVEGKQGIRIPMREISLSGGEPPLRVYDTSGPQGYDVTDGLPPLREAWIADRGISPAPLHAVRARGDSLLFSRTPVRRSARPLTQLYYARQGEITPEMEFAALREGMEPEYVRSE